ncbi:MAG: hypothetical protein H7832_13760 [Magnetococcus sp. DMHC-6]
MAFFSSDQKKSSGASKSLRKIDFGVLRALLLRGKKSKMGETEGVAGLISRPEGVGVIHLVPREGAVPLLRCCFFQALSKHQSHSWAAAEMAREFGLQKVPFVGALESNKYVILPAEAPDVPPEELSAAMRWRIKDHLDYSITEAVVEAFELPASRSGTESGRVYVAAAHEALVREYVEVFHAAKISLHSIDIFELALRNITAKLDDDAEGVGVLSLRARDGMVMVTRNKTMYLARKIDLGLERLLETLSTGRLKVEAKELANSAIVDAIALEIQRTLDYYEGHFMQNPVASLHVTPLEIPIPGLADVLSDKLGMRIKELALNSVLEFSEEFDLIAVARCLPVIGAAMGFLEGAE